MKVALCVITFRRPVGLKRLLEGVSGQTFGELRPELEVVIVDNDQDRTGQAVCDEVQPQLPWPMRYVVEPRRGISAARNKAIACALHTADFIAFIDDDEVPEPTWLSELLLVQQRHNADVVTGPIVPEFSDGVPAWIVKGKFFATPRHPTGVQRDVAYTGNVLVRSEVFRNMDDYFDERLALIGGEDSQLFRRIRRAGSSIVWADDAVAYEYIPKSRACFSWLVARFYRIGNARGLIALVRRGPIPANRRSQVGRHAQAVLIDMAQRELTVGFALLGGGAEPMQRPGRIPGNAFAFGIEVTEEVLRLCIAAGRQRFPGGACRHVVAPVVGFDARLRASQRGPRPTEQQYREYQNSDHDDLFATGDR